MRISHRFSSPLDRFPALESAFQWTLLIVAMALLLTEGSVRPEPQHLLAIPLFGLAGIAAALRAPQARHRLAFGVATTIAATIAVWSGLQAWQFEGNPLANPAWKAASEVLGPLKAAISIAPADTLESLVAVLMPFAAFLTALVVFPSDRNALALLRFMAVSGAAVALYGIIQFEFFPDYLLLREKEYYLRDLTAVLVNRNSIATYLGAALVLNAGLLYDALISDKPSKRSRSSASLQVGQMRVSGRAIFHAASATTTLVALLLTHSRAGFASTFIALACLTVFFVFDGFSRVNRRRLYGASRFNTGAKIVALVAAVGVVMLLFIALGGQVLRRADLQGLDDLRFCVYPSMIELLKDNWLLGTGLGTFKEAYMRYQDPACGHLNLIWDRAHSFYIEGWIDMGLFFVAALIASLSALLIAFATGLRKRRSLRWVPATGAALTLLYLIHGSVDFSLQIPGVAVSFALIMAASVTLSLNRGEDKKAGSSSQRDLGQRRRPSNSPDQAETAAGI